MALPGEPITEIEDPTPDPVEGAVDDNEYDESDPAGDSGGTDGTEDPAAPEAPADPYANYGGQQAVEQAIALHKATQSQDGLMRLMFEAGHALGLTYGQVEALFGQQSGSQQGNGAPQQPEFADDDVLTYGQVRELLQREVLQPWQQTEAQRTEQSARAVVAASRTELGVEDDNTWNAVLQLGDRYLGDDMSPEAVRAAIKRGHDDFVALVKSNATQYVQGKAQAKKAVPKAPAGGSMPTPGPEAEPKSVEEAIKRARAKLLG